MDVVILKHVYSKSGKLINIPGIVNVWGDLLENKGGHIVIRMWNDDLVEETKK